MKQRLSRIYKKLSLAFGKQNWWPADSAFEVMLGAILTQNTSWSNVEKAVTILKNKRLLTPEKINRMKKKRLASLIKSAGYYNIKAERIKNFIKFFSDNYSLSVKKISCEQLSRLRLKLLGVNGIGEETADSILLYALNKPIFVVDAYTKRVLERHGMAKEGASYHEVQSIFMRSLKKDAEFFNEYHALLVRLGKDYCRKKKPRCAQCPINGQ